MTQLQRSSPEIEGIPSPAILDFIRALEQHVRPLDAIQGFMLLRHGNVAAEGWWAPYEPGAPHILYSLSKSFTSTAIGIAAQEGLLTVDDPVLKFFPDDAPPNPSANLQAMRVRHLLSMNTGHRTDTTEHVYQQLHQISVFGPWLHQNEYRTRHPHERGNDNWPKTFLSLPVEHKPGTWFVYNTGATHMLSAIITKLTGESLLDFLRPRLFEPLGIENPKWETDPRGISLGGSGLHGITEDIARLGQLYLQKGTWDGMRIVTPEWVTEATTSHSDNSNTQTNPDWTAGYGYQFWRCRHNCYRGDGAFGQYCVVMPEQDAVLAMIGGVQNMQAVLDKVWTHLLPAMQPRALPADPPAHEELSEKLAVLSLPLPEGEPSSPLMDRWSGKTYQLETNHLKFETVAINFREGRSTLIVRDERGEHPIQVGFGTWMKDTTDLRGYDGEPTAATGAWIAEDTYEIRVCYYHSQFCPVFRLQHVDGELKMEVEPNVSWSAPTVTTITGRVAENAI